MPNPGLTGIQGFIKITGYKKAGEALGTEEGENLDNERKGIQ